MQANRKGVDLLILRKLGLKKLIKTEQNWSWNRKMRKKSGWQNEIEQNRGDHAKLSEIGAIKMKQNWGNHQKLTKLGPNKRHIK